MDKSWNILLERPIPTAKTKQLQVPTKSRNLHGKAGCMEPLMANTSHTSGPENFDGLWLVESPWGVNSMEVVGTLEDMVSILLGVKKHLE